MDEIKLDKSGLESLGRGEDGKFLPGHIGTGGRPKGAFSIKDLVRKHLEDSPEDLKEFVEHFIKKNRELAWQMMEGKPPQDTNISAGELPFLIKIIKDDGLPKP